MMLMEGSMQEKKGEFFPWKKINNLRPHNKSDRKEVRKILMRFYKTHPKQIQQVKENFQIGEVEWHGWLEANKSQERQERLKMEILRRISDDVLPLKEFKKLAKKAYGSRSFRPYDCWCLNFIWRNDLAHLVELPVLSAMKK